MLKMIGDTDEGERRLRAECAAKERALVEKEAAEAEAKRMKEELQKKELEIQELRAQKHIDVHVSTTDGSDEEQETTPQHPRPPAQVCRLASEDMSLRSKLKHFH